MDIKPLKLVGCFEIYPSIHSDTRGTFIKTFSNCNFKNFGLEQIFCEDFYTISKKNVIRGMHFQIPPAEQTKIVNCICGNALDVILDLRFGSPTYLQFQSLYISEKNRTVLYLPAGIAHGFLALENKTIINYKVSCGHRPEFDKGIRWDSFGFSWPIDSNLALLSIRDLNLPLIQEFQTPFKF